jgi:hypothetical protein
LASIVKNYASNRSPISHKYLNHGIYNVPIFNISNPISPLLSEAGRMMVVLTVKAKLRAHSYYDLGAPTPISQEKWSFNGKRLHTKEGGTSASVFFFC